MIVSDRRKDRQPMPEKFQRLADYNAEVCRGIVHTFEWKTRMAELQEEFYDWQRERAEAEFCR